MGMIAIGFVAMMMVMMVGVMMEVMMGGGGGVMMEVMMGVGGGVMIGVMMGVLPSTRHAHNWRNRRFTLTISSQLFPTTHYG